MPIFGRVVILPDPRESVSPGGVVIPEGASDAPQTGTVVAVDTKRKPEDAYVQVASRVLYSSYAQVVKVDGSEYVIMPEREILAVLP